MITGLPFFETRHLLHATRTYGVNFANSRSKWTTSRGGSIIKKRHVHHRHELGAGRRGKPRAIDLNMSVIPWRHDARLHQLVLFVGGILIFPHDGINGHAIKEMRETLVPPKCGDQGILRKLHCHHDPLLLQDGEINSKCSHHRKCLRPLLVLHHLFSPHLA